MRIKKNYMNTYGNNTSSNATLLLECVHTLKILVRLSTNTLINEQIKIFYGKKTRRKYHKLLFCSNL